MTDRRISVDIHSNVRRDGMVIELPIRPGGVKTVVAIVLGEDGRVYVAGPMHDPHLMKSLLDRSRAMLDHYQETKLIRVANMVVGLKGNT